MDNQLPVLQEHQAPEPTTSNQEAYTPTVEERKAIKLAHKLFDKAKKYRSKYDSTWLEDYRMFRGKQWKESRPSYRHSEVINMIFQNIQGQVPLITDAKPKFDFLPEEPRDRELAEILSHVAAADWAKYNWLHEVTESLYDAHFYGTGLASCEFDAKKNYGVGGVCIDSADPFYCFPGPKARGVNKNNPYFVYAEPVEIEELRRDYPEHKTHFKADLTDLLQGEKQNLSQMRYKSPVDQRTLVEGESGIEPDGRDTALKLTVYMQDSDFEEVEKKGVDAATGESRVEYEQRLKYPKGRKIVVAGGVLISDGPNPYDDGLFPYARLVNYIDPREFWGISEVEQLKGPQRIFNKLVSFALDVLTLMGNPIWKVSTAAGVDTDNLFNRPGLVVEVDGDINGVQREEGVQLQPYVLQLIDRMEQWFNNIGGNSDVTQGATPTGVTAASGIIALQEAAKTRIRQKSKNLDCFLQDLGQLYLSRKLQFCSAPEIVRITGNENASQYFKFHVETIKGPDGEDMVNERGDPMRQAIVQPYIEGEQGAFQDEPKVYPIKGSFDVRVATGSSLPFAKQERASLAFQLFDRKAIDEPALLEGVEYPNWQAVWERVMQRRQQEQMAQMQMQQGAAGPQGGPPQGPPPEGPPPAA